MTLTPEQIIIEASFRHDAGYWARMNEIKLQAGIFSFRDHEYQMEIMSSDARRMCFMKARQAGITEVFVLKTLHGLIFGYFAQGVLYLFPDADTVNDFSKARFNPLIMANKFAIGRYVKSGGKGTDTASLKKVGNSFLYLRGARLSQKISDVNESSKMKSIPIDMVVFDEVDHMSEEVIAKARGTMGHSKIKKEVFISNPLVPDEGIDKIFHTSDQRYWYRSCNHCSQKTCAELFFDEDPEKCVGIRADGTGFIACKNCGKEVFIRDGKWEVSVPSNSDFMHGYRWSQLTSVFNDPAEILKDFRDPPENNIADVYRLRLGKPYISAEDRLTKPEVYNCCNNDDMYFSHPGPCAMGVDVGIEKHIVIGIKINREQYQILKVVKFSGLPAWDEIHDIARRFNVRSAVVDIRPDMDIVRKFKNDARFPVFLCEYSDNPAFTRMWDIKKGIVKDYRTALFDETHRMVMTPGMLTIPRSSIPEIKEFAKQMCNAYKLLEVNERTGAKAYRYKGENDHYRNALNYFLLAASRCRTARSDGSTITQRVKNVISEYARI